MKIIYKTGDLLEAAEPFIAHGCNAKGEMGSGVAKLIRAKYPSAYDRYHDVYSSEGLKMGSVILAKCTPHTVINAITQHNYGSAAKSGKVYVDYDAVRSAMRTINTLVSIGSVAMPLIGAGLAGGSWSIIAQIIEEESTLFQPVVYLLDGVVPTT